VYSHLQKAVTVSVAAMSFSFFLLNSNFYPQLLQYQGGNKLAHAARGKLNPADVYFWKETQSSSFVFYTASLRKQFDDSVLQKDKRIWLLFDTRDEEQVKQAGYKLGQRYSTTDYEVTKLDIKFINPATRENQCNEMVVAEISK
jgi:hypothetical protein